MKNSLFPNSINNFGSTGFFVLKAKTIKINPDSRRQPTKKNKPFSSLRKLRFSAFNAP